MTHMASFPIEAQRVMQERFGKDSLIALATAVDNIPYVRAVDAYYEDGSFYTITWAKSGKMQQIAQNPVVSICGDWFTASGTAENMGWLGKEENRAIADKLRAAFAAWLDNGHTDLQDENTVILRIRLHRGTLFDHGTRHEITF